MKVIIYILESCDDEIKNKQFKCGLHKLFWNINGLLFQKILTGGHINDGKQVCIQQLTEINLKEIARKLLLHVH